MKSVESSFRVCGAGISLSDLSLLVRKSLRSKSFDCSHESYLLG